jgi:pseudaminic acid cytidylyltransferase
MKSLCVIPARGGSKRIPKKNIKNFRGKPIIAYSIEAALGSNLFSEVMVSTDSEEIADVAKRFGASVPFMRSSDLSNDFASTNEVTQDAAKRAKEIDPDLEAVCCLYATAPFITPEVLCDGMTKLLETGSDMAFSVTEFEFPILRCVQVEDDGTAKMPWPENERRRSQDLRPYYHDAGQFYWYKIEEVISREYVSFNGSAPVILPRTMVQDIDTPEDWVLAEQKMEALKLSQGERS